MPNPKDAKRLRKESEFSVRKKMTGIESGLSEATLHDLNLMNNLFDHEVHGAQLSLTDAVLWLQGKGPLRIVPASDEKWSTMFMNRTSEVEWMMHRLLPILQNNQVHFPDAWADTWSVIDQSFEHMMTSTSAQLGKSFGTSAVEFVKAKFPFHGASFFPL
jgi:hypothetical protein